MARDSTKNTLKATQTSKATTALSNLPTVRSQGTTNSQSMISIPPTVSTAIKIKATARSSPTKNNQEKEADPTVRSPSIKTLMAVEVAITTWTPVHDIKSKVATKNSTKAVTKILVTKEIRTTREVLLKMMTSQDMVDKSKVQTTTVTKVIDKITTKVRDPSSLTKSLTTTTSKRGEHLCKTPKSEFSPRRTLRKKSRRFKFPSKVSVLLKLLLQQENPKSGLSHQFRVSATSLWPQ